MPPKAYSINMSKVTDMEKWSEYGKRAGLLSTAAGAKVLAFRGRQTVIEGTPIDYQTTILEWPSYETVVDNFASPEYQAAKKFREGAGVMQMVVVEGYEEPA